MENVELKEDGPINAIKFLIVEEKEGMVGQQLIRSFNAGELPKLRSASAQAALVTIAEHLVSPKEVRKLVIEVLQQSGLAEGVGIQALTFALKQSTQTQEEIKDIVSNLEIGEAEIEKQLAFIAHAATSSEVNMVSLKGNDFLRTVLVSLYIGSI